MIILAPLGFLYGKITDIRNALYDRGVFKTHDLGARTISIGNITTGGTGKTPLVAHVAQILADTGEKVCILTRGYGRNDAHGRVLVSDGQEILADADQGGDEPVELARKLIGKALVIADADRVGAARWARETFGVTAFVLDDGFQNRRVKRDLDIVCIDATNPCGNGRVLPAGRLRESFGNLSRADAIIVTRSDIVESIEPILRRIQARNSEAHTFLSRSRIENLVELSKFWVGVDQDVDWSELRGHGDDDTRVLAFCALGNPEAFFTQLLVDFEDDRRNDEFDLSVIQKFPDHHRYSQSDIDDLEHRAREANIHAFVTTAKDAVKLHGLKFDTPCYVVEIAVEVDNADDFRKLIAG